MNAAKITVIFFASLTVLGFTSKMSLSQTGLDRGVSETDRLTLAQRQDRLKGEVQEVVSRLLGSMETSAQAKTNPNVSSIRMTTCTVQMRQDQGSGDPNAVFLYQEQAAIARLNQPYRQRFLRIAPTRTYSSVESLAFKPNATKQWIGFCNQPEAQRIVTLKDLGQPICRVYLKKVGSDYVGQTPADGCPANYRGAVRITNRIVLSESGMDTWDRGYDASGQQVWGAAAEAYQFRRIQP